MEITQIKQVGKSENYRIYLNDNYTCCLTMETIVKNKLSCGTQIDKKEIERLQFESEKIVAFDKASGYLGRGLKTEFEIRKYLKDKGYLNEIIEYVCEKLKGYGYIDDLVYAREYVNNYSRQKGRKALEFALIQKGVDKKIIRKVTENLDNSDVCFDIAEKYIKNKEKNIKTKQSLYRYLLSRGFDYDQANITVEKLFKGE